MTFADQDENNNEEAADATVETGSEADGECCADEECDNDTIEEAPESCADAVDDDAADAVDDDAADAVDDDAADAVDDDAADAVDDDAADAVGDDAADAVGDDAADAVDDDAADAVGDFPVASLEMLLMTHHTQAVMALGMMPDPMSGETSANKDAAKFHIDMLSVIEEKTKGNLTSEESESLSSILHQLRMAFFAS